MKILQKKEILELLIFYLILTYKKEEDQVNDLDKKVIQEYKVSASVFKRNLEILIKNSSSKDRVLYSLLKDEEEAWENLEDFLVKAKTLENALEVVNLANDLLVKCNDVVVEAEKTLSKSSAEQDLLSLVNKSGKQRMLSQRLCLFYMSQKILNDLPENYAHQYVFDLEEVFDQIDVNIGQLLISKFNHVAHTEDMVGAVSLEFDDLKNQKRSFINGKVDVNRVFKTTNNLTKMFNDLTMAYSKVQIQ